MNRGPCEAKTIPTDEFIGITTSQKKIRRNKIEKCANLQFSSHGNVTLFNTVGFVAFLYSFKKQQF